MTCPYTYVAGVQHSCIFSPDFREDVALVAEQPVHIPYIAQILLVSRILTYRLSPLFYKLEDLIVDSGRMDGRTFGETADKLVEKVLGTNLEMKWVSAVFDANVEEL